MKSKWVQLDFPAWIKGGPQFFIIGLETPRERDIVFDEVLTEDDIKAILDEHNLIVDKLCETACAWAESDPEGFEDYWYNDKR